MPDEQEKREAEEFEKAIEALLKVDPKGLSGKHRKSVTREYDSETDDTQDD